jgi:RNA polymerase sigma factor (sigma-70 family)
MASGRNRAGRGHASDRDVALGEVFHVQADPTTMTPRALLHPARLARRPVLSTQSDERLVDLVRSGSDPAFEAIVERYRRALMRYVSRLLSPERAEDVVQQAFLKAYEAIHRDAAELNLRPWLYRIAHNGAMNALRDRALGHAELDARIDGVERPDQALERTLGLRNLVVAVKALPERQRSAILLRELEGRSYEEIAAELGVTDGAVRQLLNRARNSLRAAAGAVVPMPLVTRVASGDSAEPVTARVAELVGAGGGALAMKVCATALVTGAVVGGAAVVPNTGREQADSAGVGAEAAQAANEPAGGEDANAGGSPLTAESGERGEDGPGGRSGSGEGDDGPGSDDRSGHAGRGPDDDREERGGPGGGGEKDDHSGSGGGGGDDLEGAPDDHSGPGGGGEIEEPAETREGSSGPGGETSGSGTSGSGTPGGETSGSGTSGSATPELDSELPQAEKLDSSGSSGSSSAGSG